MGYYDPDMGVVHDEGCPDPSKYKPHYIDAECEYVNIVGLKCTKLVPNQELHYKCKKCTAMTGAWGACPLCTKHGGHPYGMKYSQISIMSCIER
jgi:hypothetical protein